MPLSFDFRSFSIFYYFFLRAQWDVTQLRRIKSIFTYSCSQDWFLPQLGSILQKKYQIIIKQVFTSIFEYIFSSKAIAKFSMIKIIDILQKFIRLIVFLNCSFYYFENTLLERPEQHSPVKREAANFSSDVYREEYSSLRANRSTTGACRTVLELWLLWFRKLIGADRGLFIALDRLLLFEIQAEANSKVKFSHFIGLSYQHLLIKYKANKAKGNRSTSDVFLFRFLFQPQTQNLPFMLIRKHPSLILILIFSFISALLQSQKFQLKLAENPYNTQTFSNKQM